MTYKILKEITKWEVPTPNHTYFVDTKTGKCIGYKKSGGEPQFFIKPKNFDTRYRKFVKLGFGSTD